jgi:hypothetical protein
MGKDAESLEHFCAERESLRPEDRQRIWAIIEKKWAAHPVELWKSFVEANKTSLENEFQEWKSFKSDFTLIVDHRTTLVEDLVGGRGVLECVRLTKPSAFPSGWSDPSEMLDLLDKEMDVVTFVQENMLLSPSAEAEVTSKQERLAQILEKVKACGTDLTSQKRKMKEEDEESYQKRRKATEDYFTQIKDRSLVGIVRQKLAEQDWRDEVRKLLTLVQNATLCMANLGNALLENRRTWGADVEKQKKLKDVNAANLKALEDCINAVSESDEGAPGEKDQVLTKLTQIKLLLSDFAGMLEKTPHLSKADFDDKYNSLMKIAREDLDIRIKAKKIPLGSSSK